MTASPMTHTDLPARLAIVAGMEQREGSVATAEEATERSVPARTVRGGPVRGVVNVRRTEAWQSRTTRAGTEGTGGTIGYGLADDGERG